MHTDALLVGYVREKNILVKQLNSWIESSIMLLDMFDHQLAVFLEEEATDEWVEECSRTKEQIPSIRALLCSIKEKMKHHDGDIEKASVLYDILENIAVRINKIKEKTTQYTEVFMQKKRPYRIIQRMIV